MKTLPPYLCLIKASATVLFWFTVLIVGLTALFVAKTAKYGSYSLFTGSLPVHVNNRPTEVIKESGQDISVASVAKTTLHIHYTDRAAFKRDLAPNFLTFILPGLLLYGLILFGFWQLKRVFDTLGTPDVFSNANVRRIRIIAVVLVGYQLAPGLCWVFIQSDILALLDKHHLPYTINYELNVGTAFITGILILGLAEVFRSGFQLHQEQELTI